MIAEISSQKFCMSIMKTSHLIHIQLVEIWPDQSASFKKQGSSYETRGIYLIGMWNSASVESGEMGRTSSFTWALIKSLSWGTVLHS